MLEILGQLPIHSYVSGLWTVLVENDISLKTIVAFLAYLLHTGNKVCADNIIFVKEKCTLELLEVQQKVLETATSFIKMEQYLHTVITLNIGTDSPVKTIKSKIRYRRTLFAIHPGIFKIY